MADPLSTYQLDTTVKITSGSDHTLSATIIQQLQVDLTINACPVVEIQVHDVDPSSPEGKSLLPSVVAKVYDYHFLRNPMNTKPRDPHEYPLELCVREAVAYKSLGESDKVKKHLAPYHGPCILEFNKDACEYPAILLGVCEGWSPAGFSHADANNLVIELTKVIDECHRLGFTHGDLRLRNLLIISDKGDFIILDWANSIHKENHSRELFNDECIKDKIRLGQLAKQLTSPNA